jgi:replicative DNA helicase
MNKSYRFGAIPKGTVHFLFRERFSLLNESHLTWLAREARKWEIQLVVLDVLGRMIPGLEENSAKDMAEMVDRLEGLNRELGVTILILDHTRKPPAGRSTKNERRPDPNDLKGSIAKYGCADFMICIDKAKKQPGRLRVYAENKDTDERPDFFVGISPKGSSEPKFRWVADAKEGAGDDSMQKVLVWVQTHGGVGRKEICQGTGLGTSAVGEHLKNLVAQCRIRQVGKNRNTAYEPVTDRPEENHDSTAASDSADT